MYRPGHVLVGHYAKKKKKKKLLIQTTHTDTYTHIPTLACRAQYPVDIVASVECVEIPAWGSTETSLHHGIRSRLLLPDLLESLKQSRSSKTHS